MKEKIVIIGAGPAGLTTAYKLLKKSKDKYEITVLEKESIVGGISKSASFGGYIVDTGIHRFFSKNDEVNKIWQELLPIQNKPDYEELLLNTNKEYLSYGADPEKEEKALLIKKRITRIYYGKKFYDYPVSLKWETLKNMGFINIVKVFFSYLKAVILKKKETNLENFYINRFGKKLYSMFFENYTEKVWGIHPSNISADWGAQRAKGLSIKEILLDIMKRIFKNKKVKNTQTSLIEQFYYPKLGTGQMWKTMKDKIEEMGGKVICNANVIRLYIDNNNVTMLEYIDKEGKIVKLECNKCISSMPLKELFEAIASKEAIPDNIYKSAVSLPYREFMSACLLVDRINLKNNTKQKTVQNILPDSWDYIQEPEVKMGRIQIFNNWSPYLFKEKEDIKNKVLLSLEYFCSENDEYWNMKEQDFIEFAIKEAIKINLISTETKILETKQIKIKKAYPAYFGTYEDIDNIINYLNSINNLYCIGRNGQHRYNNMDHSMLTGIETANIILNNKQEKDNIWKVNTEKEYHEIKNTVKSK